MKKIIITLGLATALLLASSPAWAVCTQVTLLDDNQMCMSNDGGNTERCFSFTDLQSQNRNSWARQLTEGFQFLMERRQELVTMEIDEEARFNPPHREDFYLGDANGVHHHNATLDKYLVARCDIVEVTWDGVRFNVTVRNARRTHTPEGELIQ